VSGRTKIAIGGIIIGLILLFINPWIGLVVIAAAIAVPVTAYLMLDPSQRGGSGTSNAAGRSTASSDGSAQQAQVERRELVRVNRDQPWVVAGERFAGGRHAELDEHHPVPSGNQEGVPPLLPG